VKGEEDGDSDDAWLDEDKPINPEDPEDQLTILEAPEDKPTDHKIPEDKSTSHKAWETTPVSAYRSGGSLPVPPR
jgi:hypothetical protein